jgi:uncharacterized Tic20 family protein
MTANWRQPPASVDSGPPAFAAAVPASGPESHWDVRKAVFAYLGVAIGGVVPPLAVYLLSRRRSAFARGHAAEALRVSCAVVLYGICALIIATMLALDSVEVALIIVAPLAFALWLVLVVFLVRAARAAGRGEPRQEFPGWLRVSPRPANPGDTAHAPGIPRTHGRTPGQDLIPANPGDNPRTPGQDLIPANPGDNPRTPGQDLIPANPGDTAHAPGIPRTHGRTPGQDLIP